MDALQIFTIISDLLASGLLGLWADRDDLGEGATFARQLREQAQRRTIGRCICR